MSHREVELLLVQPFGLFPFTMLQSWSGGSIRKRVHAHGRVSVFGCMLVPAGKGELQRGGCSFEVRALLGERAL